MTDERKPGEESADAPEPAAPAPKKKAPKKRAPRKKTAAAPKKTAPKKTATKKKPASGRKKKAAASRPPTPPADPPPPPGGNGSGEAAPDTIPPDEALDDLVFGVEAAPAPGDYGPGLDTRKELPYTRKSISQEVRELERRVRARLTPAFPIEKRRRVPLEFLWKRYRDLAMRDRSDVVDEFGRDPLYSAKVAPLLEFLYSSYFRVTVEGAENIPDDGRALIVANHSGSLPYDGAMLMYAVRRETQGRREVRPLVEDFVFHFPYLGTFINRIGGVRACQENAERLLAQGQLVAVFPEGIKGIGKLYKERYRLQRFGRGGFIKLALRAHSPIVPCAVIGAEEIHPMVGKISWLAKSVGIPYVPITPTFPLLGPLGLLPLPTKWTIRFGKPLDYADQYGPSAAGDRILVNKLSETVRSTIQEMVDETLSHRKSVFFG